MVIWPASNAGKLRSWRSWNSSQSRWKASQAALRELRSQPFERMTPPMSQKSVVMPGMGEFPFGEDREEGRSDSTAVGEAVANGR
jgi:hypothetical protein